MTPLVVAVVGVAAWFAIGPRRFCWRVGNPSGGDGPTVRPEPERPPARVGRRWWRARSTGGVVDDVAESADLLALASAAGCPVHEALLEAGEARGPGTALHGVAAELERGQALADVLDRLARRGDDAWHALATTLALSAESGAPAAVVLRRLAAQERTRARRERERRARRLPVVLLLPLVGLVLPAFVLVTLVPFALSGAASFELPPPDPSTDLPEDP